MADPWSDARRAAERKADKDAAIQEIVDRNARVRTAEAKRKQPKFDKPYIYTGPFYK